MPVPIPRIPVLRSTKLNGDVYVHVDDLHEVLDRIRGRKFRLGDNIEALGIDIAMRVLEEAAFIPSQMPQDPE